MSTEHRCRKKEQHLNTDWNFDHQMSLSKSKSWYSNSCLHFSERCVPFMKVHDQLVLVPVRPLHPRTMSLPE
jgi:hypothetical protein